MTPFAQLLASLRNVRSNFVAITNLPNADDKYRAPRSARPPSTPLPSTPLPEPVQQFAQETLDELDWCLDQLETIQIHRSVSEMASSKVRFKNLEFKNFQKVVKCLLGVLCFIILRQPNSCQRHARVVRKNTLLFDFLRTFENMRHRIFFYIH